MKIIITMIPGPARRERLRMGRRATSEVEGRLLQELEPTSVANPKQAIVLDPHHLPYPKVRRRLSSTRQRNSKSRNVQMLLGQEAGRNEVRSRTTGWKLRKRTAIISPMLHKVRIANMAQTHLLPQARIRDHEGVTHPTGILAGGPGPWSQR